MSRAVAWTLPGCQCLSQMKCGVSQSSILLNWYIWSLRCVLNWSVIPARAYRTLRPTWSHWGNNKLNKGILTNTTSHRQYIHTYIHTYIVVIYSGLMSLRTAKPLEAWGKKCLVGREGKLKQVCQWQWLGWPPWPAIGDCCVILQSPMNFK